MIQKQAQSVFKPSGRQLKRTPPNERNEEYFSNPAEEE